MRVSAGSSADVRKPSRIVCCTPYFGDQWCWFVQELTDRPRDWSFFNDKRQNLLEKKIPRPSLARIRGTWQAVQTAKRQKADLLITHDPLVSLWCSVFATLLGVKVPHLAYSFNFPILPHGLRRSIMKWAFSKIDHFMVYSTVEKQIYHQHFGIPLERLQMIHWGIGTPHFEPEEPLESEDYVCAIGGNARDYETLMAAMEKLPDISLVAVVRPDNLKGLYVPPNVKVRVNLPVPNTMNIIKHSRFSALPLKGTEVPCGHVTLVTTMLLGKAIIITNSQGVSDYIFHKQNAIVCEAFNPDALAQSIRELWDDPAKSEQLGKNGLQFAQKNCTNLTAREHLHQFLLQRGL